MANSIAEEGNKNEQEDPLEGNEEQSKRRRKRKRKRKSKHKEAKEGDNREGDDDDDDSTTREEGSLIHEKTLEANRTVFVEGIPYDCRAENVREFFQRHLGGEGKGGGDDVVQEVRLPVWSDSGRLKGYGHVVLKTVDEYQKALHLSGKHYLQNRYLTVQPAHAPRGGGGGQDRQQQQQQQQHSDPSRVIMLNNLSYEATEEDVQAVLGKFGSIVEGGVRVVRYSATQRSKGYAYVEFDSLKAAADAMAAADNIVIKRRRCRLDYDHGRIRGSFRTASGRLWQKEYGQQHQRQYEEKKPIHRN